MASRKRRSDAPQHRLAALIRRLLSKKPEPDYMLEVQRDPYPDSVVYRVIIDCD